MLNRHLAIVIVLAAVLLLPAAKIQAAVISADHIKAAVTGYVEKNSRWPADRIRVSFLSKVHDEDLPVSPSQWKVSGRPGEDFIDHSSFTVGFYSGESLLLERTVSVSMEVLTDVVVSTRSLPRNRVIKPGDLSIQKIWRRSAPANLAVLSECTGKALTMSIGANREITRNMLAEPALIKRGGVVRIVLDNNALQIAAIGVSEEEGRRDQVIRVKNLSSKRVIYAKVADGDTVRVDF